MTKKAETTTGDTKSSKIRSNMRLWDSVATTDPSMAKEASNGRYKFTTVDPQWQLKQATKAWGPYGDKWGLFDIRFANLESDPPSLMLSADFRYPSENGHIVAFPIHVDMRLKAGDDVCKKLITNARSKALSWLGFSADVFMGKFDDAGYVRDLQSRFGDQNALVTKVLSAVKSAKNMDALQKCRERLQKMIADETIQDRNVAAELMAEVADREQELISG
ncbi:MAG: hypothetical protein AAF745_02705 [Planctomycetota bacterium]